ncbi:1-acyl-sn-glycerol-3-phosphate acyltransferase [Candidatus Saccharibacteria bacterium]|nr:1-acyl-sn-glycerol-3-phosphate acyltransferase [Candidatus Saccharibacteria bacterium]
MSSEITPDFSEAPQPELYERTVNRARRIARIMWRLDVIGQENVPMQGAGILAFVHRSHMDPWILAAATPRATRGMGKIELLNWYYLGLGSKYFANRGLFFVNRDEGTSKRGSNDKAHSLLDKGLLLGIAPEGNLKNRGREIGETRIGVGRMAARAAARGIDCPVVPVAMSTEHLWPGRKLSVIYGKPIDPAPEGDTIWQVKAAAKDVDERLHMSMQELYDQVLDMQ